MTSKRQIKVFHTPPSRHHRARWKPSSECVQKRSEATHLNRRRKFAVAERMQNINAGEAQPLLLKTRSGAEGEQPRSATARRFLGCGACDCGPKTLAQTYAVRVSKNNDLANKK